MIFVGSGALLWRAVEHARSVGREVDLVVHPIGEAVPPWAGEVRCEATSDVNELADVFASAAADDPVVWSTGNPFIFRKPVLDLELSIFNVHGGPLPDYRGLPMVGAVYAILNGESSFGVTVHRVDKGIDTGAIVDQSLFELPADVTLEELTLTVSHECHTIFVSNLESMRSTDPVSVPPVTGSDESSTGSYYGMRALARIGTYRGSRHFERATSLGVLADHYRFYAVLFDFARRGYDDLSAVIADLRYWWEVGQSTAAGGLLPGTGVGERRAGRKVTRLERTLDASVLQAVRTVAQRTELPAAAVVIGAVATAISDVTGREAVTLGLPVDTEAGTVPLRLAVTDELAGADLVLDVQRVIGDALAHASIPFADIADAVGERTVQTMVSVVDPGGPAPADRYTAPDSYPFNAVERGHSDLELTVRLGADGVDIHCSFATEVFMRSTIDDVLSAVGRAVAASADGQGRSLPFSDAIDAGVLAGVTSEPGDGMCVDLLARAGRESGMVPIADLTWVRRLDGVDELPVSDVVDAFVKCVRVFGFRPTDPADAVTVADLRSLIHDDSGTGNDRHAEGPVSGSAILRCGQVPGNPATFTVVGAGDLDASAVEVFARAIVVTAHALYSGDRVVFTAADAEALHRERSVRARSAEILDSNHWIDFADEHADRDVYEFDSSAAELTVLRRTVDSSLDRDDLIGSILSWIAGEVGRDSDLGVFCDVESPLPGALGFPGRAAIRYPVFLDSAVAGTPLCRGAGRSLRAAGITPPDDQVAADHDLLVWDNEQSQGIFDDVPDAEILVRVTDGDAHAHLSECTVGALGRYAAVVTMVRGIDADAGAHRIQLAVRSRVDLAWDLDALAQALNASDGLVVDLDDTVASTIADAVAQMVLVQPTRPQLVELCAAEMATLTATFDEISDVLPLSPLQEGFYYHLQIANEAGTTDLYASQARARIRGALDSDRMTQAIAMLLKRNNNLTAGFATVGGRSVQVIPADVPTPVTVLRVGAHDGDLESILADERSAVFIADRPPLIRFLLLEEAPATWTVSITFEHLLFDGWSLGLVWDELFALYGDVTGESVPDRTPYRDHVQWLSERDGADAVAAWAAYFEPGSGSGDVEPTIVAPGALEENPEAGAARDTYRYLDSELYHRITLTCRDAGVTVGTFMHVAWGIVLGRLTNRTEALFGTSVSGRAPELDGAETIIGLLFNTVPVQVRTPRTATVREVLVEHQSRSAGVLDATHLNLTEIGRIAGAATLFDTLFIIQNHPGGAKKSDEEFGPDGARITVLDGELDDSTHYPLSFAIYPTDRVRVRCSYRGDVYSADDVDVLIDRLELAFGAMASDLEAHVGQISVTTPAELAQFGRWNATARPVEDTTIAELLVAQAARTPQETAVVAGDVRMSFDELLTAAGRYASVLIRRGVRAEDRVALLLPRDERTIVALFGVFFAGAAYVPIDPDHPDERIEYILDAAAPKVVLTASGHVARVPVSGRYSVVNLDSEAILTEIASARLDPVSPAAVLPDNLAYVIFTSGSTGRPKGVAVAHRGLTNMYFNHVRKIFDPVVAHQNGRRMKIAHTTSFSFDASWEQLFWLLNGHQVHVIDEQMRKDPQLLLDHYDHERIDGFDVTPSYGQILTEDGLLARPRPSGSSTDESEPGVVFVSLGGEAVPESLWTALRDAPGVESFNLYGPTEYTINALGADLADSPTSNAGTPIDNTRAYVLDANLVPAPPGTPGELYLAGVGLARGYFSRAALTSERFVADPFDDGQRLYRTGDLVRWRPDGQIDYLGRTDDQIKIRGFRVELGEIAETLRSHPAVSAATVIASTTASGAARKDVQLAAYWVGAHLTDRELRSHTSARLPSYMVPASFTQMAALPLTTNGKIDHAALPAPVLDVPGTGLREPTSEVERTVQRVVAGIIDPDLDAALVSVDSNFADLGVDSLRLTRLASRINAAFDTALTLRTLIEHPSVGELAVVLSELSDVGSDSRCRVSEVVRPEIVPASSGQQSLWLMDQMQGPSDQYIVPVAFRLVGPVDTGALRAALVDLVIRHESLRTTLVPDDEWVVRQEIVTIDTAAQLVDIRRLDGSRWDTAAVGTAVRETILTPFSLATDLPFRVVLIEVEDGCVVGMGLHHSAFDEWSTPAMQHDLSQAYRARVVGEQPDLTPLPVQYADYAVWQRQILGDRADESSVMATQLRHWSAALRGAPQLSGVPRDHPCPAVPTWAAQWHEVAITDRIVTRLHEVARTHGVSMFILTQAVVALAVSSLGAGDDVVIGSPVGGRTDDDLADLVGYFVNTLPLRHDLSGNPTLAEVLDRARTAVLDGFAHQDAPFEEIVRAAQIERSTTHNPLFQTMLTFREESAAPAEFAPGIGVGSLGKVLPAAVKTDVELYVTVSSERIELVAGHASELFDASTIQRFTAMVTTIFEAYADGIDNRVADLEVLAESDREHLAGLAFGARLSGRLSETTTLDDLIAQQAAATPDATAVVFAGTELTYLDVDRRVNRLARLLIEHGVRVGDRVAVMMPRSVDLPVALAAVVRAGAAYVPVDASYPAERITYLLHDSAPTVVIVDQSSVSGDLVGILEAIDTVDCLVLDGTSLAEELATTSPAPVTDADRSGRLRGADAAYLIYTSGTTGRPKGVVVSHTAICNRLLWMQDAYDLDRSDRVLQKTPFSFDVSVWEFFWPLISGASMVLAEPEGHRDPEYLATLIADQQVTTLHFVPSMLAAFLESAPSPDLLRTVRRVFCSGEALPASTAADAVATFGDTVHNLYGPTEAAVDVTYQPITAELLTVHRGAGVPIGVPVADTTAFVLDRHLRPVPPGVVGELYLGGTQVARGYHRRPGLTAGRFVANPMVSESNSGDRLYRTGDLVRWNTHGRLEYLGRTDFQVKIRGFRIETEEVRSVLETHPGVGSAAVVAHTRSTGTHLAAYYTITAAQTDAVVSESSIKAHLASTLPEHMVPDIYVKMDRLPLTANGKLDRNGLPEPVAVEDDPSAEVATDDRERQIAAAVSDVLGLEGDRRVGIDRSFFSLGGDSILAVKLVSRLRRSGTVLSLRDVFAARTVRLLAVLADENDRHESRAPADMPLLDLDAAARSHLLAQVSHPGAELLPLSPLQQGLYFQSAFGATGSAVYVVQNYFDLDREIDLDQLSAAVSTVVDRTASLRMQVVVDPDGVAHQVILDHVDHVDSPVRSFDLRDEPVSDEPGAGELFTAEKSAIDTVVGRPLWRIAKIALPGGKTRILLTHHFLCFDGASAIILADRIMKAYDALEPGLQPVADHRSPAVDTGYRDFLIWNARQDRAASDRAWQRILRGQEGGSLIAPGALPHAGASKRLTLVLSEQESDALRELGQRVGVTINTVLNASLALALAHRMGSERVIFGSPNVLRPPEIDGIDTAVGLFLNTVPVAIALQPGETVVELLLRVQTERVEMLSHEYLGLGQIQKAVGSGPLFDVLFTLRNAWSDSLDIASDNEIVGGGTLDDSHYPLSIAVNPFRRIEITVDHREPDVDRNAAEQMLAAFRRVLISLPTVADSTVGSVPVADEPMLMGQARTCPDRTVADMLHDRALIEPDSVALVMDEERVTFRDLNNRVNQLTRILVDRGVGPERVVGLALPRSVDMVVSLFAVLRAGGAYLPLELDHPTERLALTVTDAAPVLVVSVTDVWPALTSIVAESDTDVLLLDDPAVVATGRAQGSEDLRDDELDAFLSLGPSRMDIPAYVIYTSGSTGVPKGVITPYVGLTNMVINHREAIFGPVIEAAGGRKLRIAHTVSFSFDMSWEELLWMLEGHEVHICDEELRRDGGALVDYCHAHSVDVVNVTPTYAHHLFELGLLDPDGRGDPDVRGPALVLLGGEAVSDSVWGRLRTTPDVTGYNLYGPTEYTINALGAGTDDSPTPTVGGPIANSVAHVLDRWLRPVPVGVEGELYLSGPGLARGYLNRFGVTAGRFVADPTTPGVRMYRTGDVVRRRGDGHLDFLGRSDDQVKIRGHRVELGEVDAAITGSPAVSQCAVLVQHRADPSDSAAPTAGVLVAHLVVDPDSPLSGRPPEDVVAAVRDHIGVSLPTYMVPGLWSVVSSLPMTVNGKLDVTALPEPAPFGSTSLRAPRTETEIDLCAIFAEVLSVEAVGVDDDFFEFGGDSISSLTAASRARKRGYLLKPGDIMQLRTVEAIAERLDAAAEPTTPDVAVAIDTGAVGEVPSTPIVERYLAHTDAKDGFYQALTLSTPPQATMADLVQLLQGLIDVHHGLRATCVHRDGVAELEIPEVGGLRAETVVSESRSIGDRSAHRQACLARAAADLDPWAGRMISTAWIPPSTADAVVAESECGELVVVVHHLVVDGVSWRLLTEDLADMWAMLEAGRQPMPAAEGTSWRAWAHTYTEQIRAGGFTRELPYWKHVAMAEVATIGRPADGSGMRSGESVSSEIVIGARIAGPILLELPRILGGEVNDVLLTTLAVALDRWRSQMRSVASGPVAVTMEGHGREERVVPGADLSRTVGWFTTVFPVVLEPGHIRWSRSSDGHERPDIRDLRTAFTAVSRVLRTVPDKGIGYGSLHSRCAPERLSSESNAEVLFNYLGRLDTPDEARPWAPAPGTSLQFGTAHADDSRDMLEINAISSRGVSGTELRINVRSGTGFVSAADIDDFGRCWHDVLAQFARLEQVSPSVSGGQDRVPAAPVLADVLESGRDNTGFFVPMLVEMPAYVSATHVEQAFAAMARAHPVLRSATEYSIDDDRWWHRVIDPRDPDSVTRVESVDATDLSDTELVVVEAAVLSDVHRRIRPEDGRMCALTHISRGDAPGRLLIAISHLVIDAMSWQILLRGLACACEDLVAGRDVVTEPESVSFVDWSARLSTRDLDVRQAATLEEWVRYARRLRESRPGPLSSLVEDGAGAPDSARALQSVVLEPELTQALVEAVPRALGASTGDILLTALLTSLSEVSGQRGAGLSQRLLLQGHGRAESLLDGTPESDEGTLASTVGYFAEQYPAVVAIGQAGESASDAEFAQHFAAAVRGVQADLATVPESGEGFSHYRRLIAEGGPEIHGDEVAFNYEGRFENYSSKGWALAPEERQALRAHTERLGGNSPLAAIARVVVGAGGEATMSLGCSSPGGTLAPESVTAVVERWHQILEKFARLTIGEAVS